MLVPDPDQLGVVVHARLVCLKQRHSRLQHQFGALLHHCSIWRFACHLRRCRRLPFRIGREFVLDRAEHFSPVGDALCLAAGIPGQLGVRFRLRFMGQGPRAFCLLIRHRDLVLSEEVIAQLPHPVGRQAADRAVVLRLTKPRSGCGLGQLWLLTGILRQEEIGIGDGVSEAPESGVLTAADTGDFEKHVDTLTLGLGVSLQGSQESATGQLPLYRANMLSAEQHLPEPTGRFHRKACIGERSGRLSCLHSSIQILRRSALSIPRVSFPLFGTLRLCEVCLDCRLA
ncbi:hypothetical protein FQZ97_855380 [compost metagenome]